MVSAGLGELLQWRRVVTVVDLLTGLPSGPPVNTSLPVSTGMAFQSDGNEGVPGGVPEPGLRRRHGHPGCADEDHGGPVTVRCL